MIGSVDERLGFRFADMSEVYDRGYREIAISSANNLGLSSAVFAGHSGPSYETPAEIRSLRNQGADIVGMSVVPEVIAGAAPGNPRSGNLRHHQCGRRCGDKDHRTW